MAGVGATEDAMVGGITDSMDIHLSKLWEIMKDREGSRAAAHAVTETRTWLSSWTTSCVCYTQDRDIQKATHSLYFWEHRQEPAALGGSLGCCWHRCPGLLCLLISRLQSPFTATLELKKVKSVTVSTYSPSICHEVMGQDAMILVFWMPSFKPFHSTLSPSSRGS